jgi:hypothetical protein
MTSLKGMPRARDNVFTVPSVGRRRPVSRSRSVLGSMSAAWVNCARVQPRRIRSRSTTSERTSQPNADASMYDDARSFIPLITAQRRWDRTHQPESARGSGGTWSAGRSSTVTAPAGRQRPSSQRDQLTHRRFGFAPMVHVCVGVASRSDALRMEASSGAAGGAGSCGEALGHAVRCTSTGLD